MPQQERRVVVSLISALIVFAVYAYFMVGYYQDGRFDGPGAGSLIGKSTIALIVAGIVASIVLQIVFAIGHAVATKEHERILTDERDKAIDLKAMQIGYLTFSVGFLVSMIVLATEMASAPMVLIIIVVSMFASSVVGDVVKLALYRQGF